MGKAVLNHKALAEGTAKIQQFIKAWTWKAPYWKDKGDSVYKVSDKWLVYKQRCRTFNQGIPLPKLLSFLAVGSQNPGNTRDFFGFSERIRRLPPCLDQIGAAIATAAHQNRSIGTSESVSLFLLLHMS